MKVEVNIEILLVALGEALSGISQPGKRDKIIKATNIAYKLGFKDGMKK